MAVTSDRYIAVTYSEDLAASFRFNAESNVASEAGNELLSLDSGDNTITVPTGGGNVTAVTIVPPESNTGDDEVIITLRGDPADVGIILHSTDPTSIALSPDQADFIINVDDDLDGTRFIWS